MKKKVNKAMHYDISNKYQFIAPFETAYSAFVNEPMLDLSYKQISLNYLTSQLLNSFCDDKANDRANLWAAKPKCDVVNEITLSIEGCEKRTEHKKKVEDTRANDIAMQEVILKLSIERNILMKQLDDALKRKRKDMKLYHCMRNEYKQLSDAKDKYTSAIISNEAEIQALNDELKAYYEQKKLKKKEREAK